MNERRGGGHRLVLATFALAHVLLFAVVYHSVFRTPYSGVGLYFDFASKLVNGAVPYRDFPLEYPPFALVFFTLPRLVSSTLGGYYLWFQVEVIVADLGVLIALSAIAHRRGATAWPSLAGYTAAVALLGPIVGQQFDIFPAALTVAALYSFWRERHSAGWALIALGTLTKLYPLLTAPVWLLAYSGERPARYALRSAGVFAATCVIGLAPTLVLAPSTLRSFFAYHAERGIQIESVYATAIRLADKLGLTYAGTVMSFGSWNVTGAVARVMTPISTLAFITGMSLVVVFLRRQSGRALRGPPAVEWLASAVLLMLGVALITSKVLSPQYLIWLLPFVPLVSAAQRLTVWTTFGAVGIVTYYIFPMHYLQLIAGDTAADLALLARNLLLIGLVWLAAVSVRDSSPVHAP